MSRLSLTVELAKSILYASEGAAGGHTRERHIDITRDQLRSRYINPASGIGSPTAFISMDDAAVALAASIAGQQDIFVTDFGRMSDGRESGMLQCTTGLSMRVRYGNGEGIYTTDRFALAMRKRAGALGSLVVITFYPLFGEVI